MPASALPFVIASVGFFTVFMLTLAGAWIATSLGGE